MARKTESGKTDKLSLRAAVSLSSGLDSPGIPAVVTDSRLVITAANEAFKKLINPGRRAVVKKRLDSLFPRGSRKADLEKVQEYLKTASGQTLEIDLECGDGSIKRVRWYMVPVYADDSQKVSGTLLAGHDITKCSKTEMTLQEIENFYEIVSELVFGFAFVYDVDRGGRFSLRWVGETALAVTGQGAKELLGRGGWEKLLHREDERMSEEDRQALLEGKPVTNEYRIITKDGKMRWVRDFNRPVKDANEERVAHIYGAVLDITESRLSEEARLKSELRTQAILNAIPDLMFNISADGVFIGYKGSREDLFLEPKMFLGKKIDEVLPPDLARTTTDRIELVREKKKTQIYEYQLPIKDEIRYFETRMVDCGEDEVLAIIRNITERKLAEKKLKESEEKYSGLFHQSNDAIFIHDLEGSILEINSQVLELFGYSKEELLKLRVMQLHPTRALAKSKQAFEAVSKKGSVNMEIDFMKKDGEIFPAELSASIIEMGGDRIVQGIVRDITERKRAEGELKNANEKLRMEQDALKEKNIALREILGQIEEEKKLIAGRFQSNIDRIVLPSLNRLAERLGPAETEHVVLIRKSLEDITAPFVNTLEKRFSKLTRRELELCNMIRSGMTSKEIASALSISVETVRSQRKNIRRKLEITDNSVNLSTYLQTV